MTRKSFTTSDTSSRTNTSAAFARAFRSREAQNDNCSSNEMNSIISIIMPGILSGILLTLALSVSVLSLALVMSVIVVVSFIAVLVRLTRQRYRPPVEP